MVQKISLLSFLTVTLYAAASIIYVFQLPNLDSAEIRIEVYTRIIEAALFLICLFFYLIGSTRARLILLGILGFMTLTLLDVLITPFIHESGNLLLAFFQLVAISVSSITVYELIKSLDIKQIESQFSEKTPVKITIGFFLIVALILAYGVYRYYETYISCSSHELC